MNKLHKNANHRAFPAQSQNAFRRNAVALALTGVLFPMVSMAEDLPETSTAGADLGPQINWTTTIKQSAAFRLNDRNTQLVEGGSSAAQDDGDRNFAKGLISNRSDILSELDIKFTGFALRVSGTAWYDQVYQRGNSNDSSGTSQGPGNQFAGETRKLHGGMGEILDAFLITSTDIAGKPTNIRIGQHTLIYGESLFFGGNGVAYAMAPIDVIKATQVPGAQFKEFIRPVPQISGEISLSPNMSLGAYYQFKWEKTRLPGAGSYLSSADMIDAGGTQLQLIPPIPAYFYPGFSANRTADQNPQDSGQGGVQLKFTVPEIATDFGLYALHYHERLPNLVLSNPIPTGLSYPAPTFLPSQYHLEYGADVNIFGASFSKTFDSTSVAAELSMRDGAYLAADPLLGFLGQVAPRGQTLHLNISALASFEPNFIAKEATAAAELACNKTLSVTNGQVAQNSTVSACAVKILYEPKYRQITSGLDLSIPMSVSYTKGQSSAIPFFGADNSGDVSISLNFNYLEKWRVSTAYTHYFGPVGTILDSHGSAYTFNQSLADRDYLSVSISTTF